MNFEEKIKSGFYPSQEELIVYYNEAKQKFAEGYLYCSVSLETKEIYYE